MFESNLDSVFIPLLLISQIFGSPLYPICILIQEAVPRQHRVFVSVFMYIETLPVAQQHSLSLSLSSRFPLCLPLCSWPACRISSAMTMCSWPVGQRSFATLRTTLCWHTAAKHQHSLAVSDTHTLTRTHTQPFMIRSSNCPVSFIKVFYSGKDNII